MSPEALGVDADLGIGTVALVKMVLSGLLIAAILFARWGVIRLIRGRSTILTDGQRYWMTVARNVGLGVIVAGLAALWARELQQFALSIAAFALALVIAVKELVLCMIGAVWRGASAAFSVGDWIEVGPYSGEVVDENLLATVLQEIEPYDYTLTGRTVSVPNSMLFTSPVINHSFRKRFIYFTLDIHAEPHSDALRTRERIEQAVMGVSGEFAELARRYAARIEKLAMAKLRDPAPAVTMHTTDFAKLVFRVTAFCPRDHAASLRAAAMAAFLEEPPRPA